MNKLVFIAALFILAANAAPAAINFGLQLPLQYDTLPAAAKLALAEINNSPKILPGINFTCTLVDEQNPIQAVEAILPMIGYCNDTAPVVAVIGGAFSTSCVVSQNLLAGRKIPQISPTATSPALSSKAQFPYFLRAAPPDGGQAAAILGLIKKVGWTRVGFVGSNDAYGTGGALAFSRVIVNTSVSVGYTGIVDPAELDYSTTLNGLRKARCKVIVAFIQPGNDIFARFISQASAAGLTGVGYTWLWSESLPIDIFTGKFDNKTQSAIETALTGSFAIFPVTGTGDTFDLFKESWSALGRDVSSLGFIETYTYDSIYMLAYALDHMVSSNQNVNNGTLLLEILQQSNFTGASGIVVLDENSDRVGTYDILNFRKTRPFGSSSTLERVGELLPTEIQLSLENATWSSVDNTPPSDGTDETPRKSHAVRNGLIGGGVALFVLIVLGVVALVMRKQFHFIVIPRSANADNEWGS